MSQEELNAVQEAETAENTEETKAEAAPVENTEAAPAEKAEAAPAEKAEASNVRNDRSRNPDRRHSDGVPAIIRRRRPFGRRKVCRFCVDPTLQIDFRDPQLLKYFVTERGKIIPRRISGNCAKHQRQMARSIKRARVLGLMPFTVVTS